MGNEGDTRSGIGSFLRSLLAGIPWSERAEGESELRIDPPAGRTVRVDNANGRTRITGEDRKDILIRICRSARAETEQEARRLMKAIRVVPREDGAGNLDLEVEIPGRWNRRGRADLDIHLPRELRVQVSTANGRLCLAGLRGSVRARSSNGSIRVNDVIGDVEIQTSNAKVHTQCTCGKLVARSSNGNIEMMEHRGSVDAATSNGTICCEIEDMGKEGVVLVTSNGRIRLDLPEDAAGDVDVRVDNGLIRTTRELPQATQRSGRLKGTLGRGGCPIRLRASNGTISIR